MSSSSLSQPIFSSSSTPLSPSVTSAGGTRSRSSSKSTSSLYPQQKICNLKTFPSNALYFPLAVSQATFMHKITLWNQHPEKAIYFFFDLWDRNDVNWTTEDSYGSLSTNKDLFLNGIYEFSNLSGFSGCIGPGECRILNLQRVYSAMDDTDSETLAMGWCFLEDSQKLHSYQRTSPLSSASTHHSMGSHQCGPAHRHEWACRFSLIPQSVPLSSHQDKECVIISQGNEEIFEKLAGKRCVSVTYATERAPHERYALHEMYVLPKKQRLIAPNELTEKPVFYACASCNTKVEPQTFSRDLSVTNYTDQCERCYECPLCGAYLIASEANEWRYFYCGYCKWTSVHLEHGKVPNSVKFNQLFHQVTEQEKESARALEQQRGILSLKETFRTMQKEVHHANKTHAQLKTEMPDLLTLQAQQLQSNFPSDITQFMKVFEGKRFVPDPAASPNTLSLEQLFSKESALLRQRSSANFDYKTLLPLQRRQEQPGFASENIYDLYPFRRKLYPRTEKRFENNWVLLPDATKIDFEINSNATLFLPVAQVTHIPVFMYHRKTHFRVRFLNPTDYGMTLRFSPSDLEYNTATLATTENTIRLSPEDRYASSPAGASSGETEGSQHESPTTQESEDDPFILSQSSEGDYVELRFNVTPQRCDRPVRAAIQMECEFATPQQEFKFKFYVCFDFGFPRL